MLQIGQKPPEKCGCLRFVNPELYGILNRRIHNNVYGAVVVIYANDALRNYVYAYGIRLIELEDPDAGNN